MYQPDFTINNQTIRYLSVLSGLDLVFRSRLLPMGWKRRFEERARIESIHFTLAMDDNPLSLEQVMKILDSNPTRDEHAQNIAANVGLAAKLENIQEAVNLYLSYGYLDKMLTKGMTDVMVDQSMLLNLHALVVEKTIPLDQVGVLRKVKIVVKNDATGEVVYVPPTPVELEYQLNDFFQWLISPMARDLHPVVKTAIAFAELSRIYPMSYGNARTLRVFTRMLMELSGLPVIKALAYERQLTLKRAAYYRTLLSSIKKRDLSSWIEFFAEMVAAEAELMWEEIEKSDSRPTPVPNKAIAMNDRQIQIMEFLRLKGFVGLQDIRGVSPKVSDDSVLRDLKDLIAKGLVKKKGKTKAARYGLKTGVW
jgi:Fic family protein